MPHDIIHVDMRPVLNLHEINLPKPSINKSKIGRTTNRIQNRSTRTLTAKLSDRWQDRLVSKRYDREFVSRPEHQLKNLLSNLPFYEFVVKFLLQVEARIHMRY